MKWLRVIRRWVTNRDIRYLSIFDTTLTIKTLCFSEVEKNIFSYKMIIIGQILEFEVSVELYSGLLIIDIKYVNKQTNNIYINKQTTAKAEFNPNSIKNLFNVKTTFKNLFHNLIQNITNLKIFMTWPTRRCYLLKLLGLTDY